MRQILTLTLALVSCSNAAGPASRPVAPALEAGPALASSEPASEPADDGRPIYTRTQMRFILRGVEYEKGDIAADRDRWKTKAQLGEGYAAKLEAELAEAQTRAVWVPIGVGVGTAAFVATLTAIIVRVYDVTHQQPAAAPAP